MITTRAQILTEIEDFLKDTGTSTDALGKHVVQDGRLVARLRDGKDITTGTLDQIRAYMSLKRAEQAVREGGA